MAALVLLQLLLISSLFAGSDAIWCVCRGDAGAAALQAALDYACGHGADCGPVLQNGACYQPNTVASHCSYAVNSYFQRQNQGEGSCIFSGTAMTSANDPSYSGCSYPASASTAGTGGAPTATGGAPIATGSTPTAGAPSSTSTPATNTSVFGFGPASTTSIPPTDGAELLKAPASLLSLSAVAVSGIILLGGWR